MAELGLVRRRKGVAKVRVRNESMTIEVPDGAPILPYLWDNTSFPQGCEDGSTTICACVVLSGEANINPKTQQEI